MLLLHKVNAKGGSISLIFKGGKKGKMYLWKTTEINLSY